MADDAVRQALVEVGASAAGDLGSVTRPLLIALRAITGLDSAYLTSIDWRNERQRVEVADNGGALAIEEGLDVAWDDALCRRAIESGRYVSADVPGDWGDCISARELGIRTYVSARVVLADGEVYGTLCGASSRAVEVSEQTRAVLTVFSRLVAETVARERRFAVASERADQSDRLLRARSEFIAASQHRLKTPLTVIQGWASILLDDTETVSEEERTIALQAIARAAGHAAAEVESMLAAPQTGALTRDADVGPVDVAALARESAQDLTALSERHRVVAEVDGDPPLAHSDPVALRIVLEHLVDNAVKYSPDGGTVRIQVGLSDGGRVRLSVCDEGVGLPSGFDIFAPFARGKEAAGVPGTGLGLHVVQSLVHAVGGGVTARRNPDGRGSTLTVLLPRANQH